MINSELVDKIRKLLALSSSSNQHEADLAMQMAKSLAVKNDIDLATVNVKEEKEEPIVKGEKIVFGKRQPITTKYINWILDKHFNVKVINHRSRFFGSSITMIGKTSDLQIANYVQNFLSQEFMSLWHKYHQKHKGPVTERNSYFWGLYEGLNQKLEAAKKETEFSSFEVIKQEKGLAKVEEIKQNYSLMIVSKEKKLQTALEDFFPDLKKGPKTRINLHSQDARFAGQIAGKNINLRPAIQQNQQQRIN